MRFSCSSLCGVFLLSWSAVAAQVPIANPITIDSARALLGTDPVAVPNTPVRFFALMRRVLVVQEVDTGVSAAFLEWHGPTTFPINSVVPCPDPRARPWYDAYIGRPTCEELRMRARNRYRYIGRLNVYLLYDEQARVALSGRQEWSRQIPSEQFIDIDDRADLRAEAFMGVLAPMRNIRE